MPTPIKLPLDALLLRLQREGFAFGVDKHLQLQILLRELADEYKEEPEALKRLIGPILVRSRDEQEKFQRIFDEYYEEEIRPHIEQVLDTQPESPETDTRTVVRPDRISRWLSPLIFLLSAALIAALFLIDIRSPLAPLHPSFIIQADSLRQADPSRNALYGVGDTVIFRNQTQEIRGRASAEKQGIEFVWDFGDGSQKIITQDEKEVGHVYREPGHYYVSLGAARTDDNADSTVSRPIEIYCPDAIFLEFGFFFEGNSPSTDDYIRFEPDVAGLAKNELTYEWNFGDGSTATEATPVHQYTEAGTYTATLQVRRNDTLALACSNFATYSTTFPISKPEVTVMLPAKTLVTDQEPEAEMTLTVFAAILIGLLIALVIFGLLLGLIQYRQRDYSPKSLDKFIPGDERPFDIPYPNQDALISPDQDLYTLAAAMRKRQAGEIHKLDLKATIRETIESVGLPNLAFDTASKPSEYLILIEQPYIESHQTHLFARIVEILKEEDVLLETWFFDTDMRICWNEDRPEGINLAQLRQLYAKRRLVLFGNGYHLIDAFEAKLQDWVPDMVEPWQGRALILTPTTVADWGYRERLLRDVFTLLPVDIQGQLAMVDKFNAQELPDYNTLRHDLKQLIPAAQERISAYDFEDLTVIREYLGPDLFEWVAATAVYPWPTWEITLAIGKALSDHPTDTETAYLLTYSNLLRIARIPWMHTGQLPATLRYQLLATLSPKTEQVAREAVLEILRQIQVPKDSFVSRKIAIQETTHQFLLTPGDEEIAREMNYLLKNEQITDRATLQKMDLSSAQFDGESPKKHLRKRFAPLKSLEVALAVLLGVFLTAVIGYTLHQQYDRTPELKQWAHYLDADSSAFVRYIPQIDSAIYYNNVGVQAYYDSARKADAIGYFETASSLRESGYELPKYNLALYGYNEGIVAYADEEYEQAITQLGTTFASISQSEDSLQIELGLDLLHAIGLSYFYQGEEANAAGRLEQILLKDSTYFERVRPNLLELLQAELGAYMRYISQADSSFESRAYAAAIMYSDSALQIKPKDPRALDVKEKAEAALATLSISDQVLSIIRTAEDLFQNQQYQAAKTQYQVALELLELDPEAKRVFQKEVESQLSRCDEYLTGSSAALYFYEDIDAAEDFGNGKVYLFKGDRCIRYDKNTGTKDPEFPMSIEAAFPRLPTKFHRDLDAVLNYDNTQIFFIKEGFIARYNKRNRNASASEILADELNGWPRSYPFRSKIDAATGWDNSKAYFTSGPDYIGYVRTEDEVGPNYPKQLKDTWRSLPDSWHQGFDAAFFAHIQKKCYIFRGKEYAVYDSPTDQILPGYPKPLGRAFIQDLTRSFEPLTPPVRTDEASSPQPASTVSGIQNDLLQGTNIEVKKLSKIIQRRNNPQSIIIGYTTPRDEEGALSYIRNQNLKQSFGYHVLIDRSGKITQLMAFDTYGKGLSRAAFGKKGEAVLEQESIIINLMNLGWVRQTKLGYEDINQNPYSGDIFTESFRGYSYWQPYTQAQLSAIENVCKELIATYGIREIMAQSDIMSNKFAPGPAFPMDRFRSEVLTYGPIQQGLPTEESPPIGVPATQYARAINQGKVECPPGSFYDSMDGGTCWTCPDGFRRTVYSVKSGNACERIASTTYAKAKAHGKATGLLKTDCPPGSRQFWDPNGTCYSCPEGYNRTLYPVTSSKACAKTVRAQQTKATQTSKLTCAPGSFYDLYGGGTCWTCPDGYVRTVNSITSEKACQKK